MILPGSYGKHKVPTHFFFLLFLHVFLHLHDVHFFIFFLDLLVLLVFIIFLLIIFFLHVEHFFFCLTRFLRITRPVCFGFPPPPLPPLIILWKKGEAVEPKLIDFNKCITILQLKYEILMDILREASAYDLASATATAFASGAGSGTGPG